jgi:hypothetical protein
MRFATGGWAATAGAIAALLAGGVAPAQEPARPASLPPAEEVIPILLQPPAPPPGQPQPYQLPPAGLPVPEDLGRDPLLDRPFTPQPGWFTNAEVALLGVHLRNQLVETVTVGDRTDVFDSNIPGSRLNAAVSPRFEAGYRMPNGNGEFALGYRFLTTTGSDLAVTPYGVGDQAGRLDLNIIDLDYNTREYSLGPFPGDRWDFRWTFGLRLLRVDFDNRLRYRLAPDAGPDAVAEQRTTNNFIGVGPHAALVLQRRLCWVPGLAFGGRIEGADAFGEIHQRFSEGLAGDPTTGPLFGQTSKNDQVGSVYLHGRVGFSYDSPGRNHSQVFLGYQYETFFHVGRLDDSRAQLDNQGLILRAEINY